MKHMQAREAKAKFSELLDIAEHGDAITITRHGKSVAMIVPFERGEEIYPPKPRKTLGELLLEFPGGIDLDELRDRTPMREIDL